MIYYEVLTIRAPHVMLFFSRLKHYRGVAVGYAKRVINFAALIYLAACLLWIKWLSNEFFKHPLSKLSDSKSFFQQPSIEYVKIRPLKTKTLQPFQ